MSIMAVGNLLRLLIAVFFGFLTICLFVRVILSWFPIPPSNPIIRFFNNITAPILEPVRKRLPAMTIGFFDISWTVAFLFTWWALGVLSALLISAIP